ncbi:MAG: bifunctional DNA-formamidopyrimidine glycosylase/DNA-(apurinic or apyrimidinic site) lyase [Alphaproteobacteria bacterium]|jgi:formamidopyrimidine-DNA glycosylase
MPELPEVETTRRGLVPVMRGQVIVKAEVRRGDLRLPLPDSFAHRLAGRRVLGLRRRAKYLLIDLDNGEILLIHLGMSGSLRVLQPSIRTLLTHDHVVFHLDSGQRIVFHDPRRFGLMDIFPSIQELTHKLLNHMGPEPLGAAFSPDYLAARLAHKTAPLKVALMDQRLVVGVGNIYASESLFLAGLHPALPAYRAQGHEAALIAAIKKVLEAAIASGGSSLRDYTQVNGETGYFQHRFNVYERLGEPCYQCGSRIEKIKQAGRASYFCPTCQSRKKIKKNYSIFNAENNQ